MAIYADSLPYLRAQNKRVALPRNSAEGKSGFDNLVFLFSDNVGHSIKMMNNPPTCYPDGKYKYYYYNLLYRGTISGRRYNIKSTNDRKIIYKRIETETAITPHPPSLLNVTANRNTYFELFKYFEIYKYMCKHYSPQKKVNLFWAFFKTIWFSTQTETFSKKYVLLNVDNFPKFNGSLKDTIDNPVFMLYYTLYKRLDLVIDLDIDFLLYCGNMVMRLNPSKCDEKSYVVFRRELRKLLSKVSKDVIIDDVEIDTQEQKEVIKTALVDKYNFTGNDSDNNEEVTEISTKKEKPNTTVKKTEKIKELLDKKIDAIVDENISKVKEVAPEVSTTSKEVVDFVKTQAELDMDKDKELIQKMYNVMKAEKVPTTPLSSARDAQLRSRQESLKIDGITFDKLDKVSAAKSLIPVRDISKSVKTINPSVKKLKYSNINKDYIDNFYKEDIVKVFKSLNNKSNKLFIRDIKINDSSNELNYKDTYNIVLEDENKQRHNVNVDMPKFLENKFLYLGGNKKIINKQNFLYPVVKTAPDTVQIVTNYNKMFIRRIGTKSISSVERIMKLISSNNECQSYFTTGNNTSTNRMFITTIEYDEFSKVLTKFETKNCTIFFNQQQAIQYANDKNIDIPKDNMFIGLKDNKPVFIDVDTQVTTDGEGICDLIITELPEALQKDFSKIRSTKKLMYNTVTIMAQSIPFIVLLMYWEGITSVFNKLKLKYSFSPKYPSDVKANESIIKFKDSYFIYQEDLATSLLMNGIKVLDTENHDMDEYNTNEPYLDYFKKVYGKVSIVNALYNAYEFTLDPITLEILDDINLPTDLVELCIYASNLLADESYTMENSQTLSRIRSTEIIPAILYNEISRAYIDFKNSAGKKKLSIPKDSVIKQLLALQTVEDYSTLNPVVELEKDRAITSKGFRGINVDRAYSEQKRSYDKSMVGIMAISTSPDGNCGINRFLTLEPAITSARGYVDIKADKLDELTDANLFSPTELLYPLGNTKDDSIRTAMAGKQSKHVIPVQNSSPALISNGVDEVIKYQLSSDFVVIAEEDGVVVDYNDKTKILIVEYKSGKHRAVNLAPSIVKNGGGGFYLANQLITKYKVGDRFKKDDTLAWHKDFFKEDRLNGVRMNVGVLEKVAIISSYNTYNDSTVITEKLANDAKASMTFCKSVVVGKNSNIYNMKKIGDHIQIGDSLLDYDVSFEDSDLNKLLSHLSEENKQVLEENSVNSIKSKYAGNIIDIKIYSTVELEELSPSLSSIVKSYYSRISEKKKFVSKYDPNNNSIVKCGLLLNETTGKIEPNIYGVLKGEKVEDSVLIEFYIEHDDVMGVGDKLAYFTALKGIIGEIIPKGYEPYSEFRPNEEISSLIGPSAIIKRQTPSIIVTVLGNKVIVELKRKLEEIYNS